MSLYIWSIKYMFLLLNINIILLWSLKPSDILRFTTYINVCGFDDKTITTFTSSIIRIRVILIYSTNFNMYLYYYILHYKY